MHLEGIVRLTRGIRWTVIRALLAATTLLLAPAGWQASARVPSTTGTTTEFGVQIDGRYIVPTVRQLQMLHSRWERGIVGTRTSSHMKQDDWCRSGKPTLGSVFSPSVNWMLIFNNQSCSYNAPLGSIKPILWQRYIDRHYIPDLRAFLSDNADLLRAKKSGAVFEIWNEENCPANHSYIPPAIYAHMLVRAAALIQRWDLAYDAHVGTMMGGLCNPKGEADGDSNYAETVLRLGGAGLRQVGAIGIHPSYGTVEPAVWTMEINYFRQLVNQYAATDGFHPIWINETGASGELGSRASQARFAGTLFRTLVADRVPVVIWYAFSDGQMAKGGYGGWGLIDECGLLKPAGAVFAEFAGHLRAAPPSGSTAGLHVVQVHPSRGHLTVKLNANVRCPASTETPWRPMTITDFPSPPARHAAHDERSRRWKRPYRTGGTRFSVRLTPGGQYLTSGYAGDYQLEGGSSASIWVRVSRCPSSWSPWQRKSVSCDKSVHHAVALVGREYRKHERWLGHPLAAGAILSTDNTHVFFFAHRIVMARGHDVWLAGEPAVVRLFLPKRRATHR
jgi:hypothetical protein